MTLRDSVPPKFRAAVASFADELRRNFALGIPAQPEDQLKALVCRVLGAAADQVETRTEVQVAGLGARPDLGVSVRQLLCGYVELKAPGTGARTERFRGHDQVQWAKFRSLPNVLYTDGCEWALYRSGAAWPGERPLIAQLGDITAQGSSGLDGDGVADLHTLLVDFLSWQPLVPTSAAGLAQLLAPLCRLLREDVQAAIANPGSNLASLNREIRDYLFPEVTDAQFADIYAQTLTYALLLARLTGEQNLAIHQAAAALDSGHGLLAQTLRILGQPEARQEIELATSLLERVIGAMDPALLLRQGDPWLYFYEDFLAAYDPALRKQRGVYYTPHEVVECQVRLVAELLTTRFDKPLTFADPDVILLDPGAGTAAYPLAAVADALARVAERFGPGLVPAKASVCAENVHAFEILVGPYAVAHLRLTQLIRQAGGSLPADGVHVYLTDTLENPNSDPPQPPLFARKLTEEHRRAQAVKNHARVLVCMGNPPYHREDEAPTARRPGQRRPGGWVRYGDPEQPGNHPILQDFIEPAAAQPGSKRNIQNLYNDYVYFWRWALWKLFENPHAHGPGIISFITAASYLRGPGFVGMRQRLREAFDDLWIIDLEGDSRGTRVTENVFAIQTPVAIAIGVRYRATRPHRPGAVHYVRLSGTAEQKLARLATVRTRADLPWADCYPDWQQPLLPVGRGDYFSYPLLTDLFPWQACGCKFERNWPIAETEDQLLQRWRRLLAAPAEERQRLFREDDDRQIGRVYRNLLQPVQKLPTLLSLPADAPPLHVGRYAARSLDRRCALVDNRVGGRMNPTLWRAHGEHQVYLTSLLTGVLGRGPAAMACANVPDLHHFRGSFGGRDVIPLWRNPEGTRANVTPNLLARLSAAYRRPVSPADLFAYAYGVLSCPAYTASFMEELTIPGPRLPITKDGALFAHVAAIGRRLLWLHTYGERMVPPGQRRGHVPRRHARCQRGVPDLPAAYPERFSYEESSRMLRVGDGEFSPVPKGVWEFAVSGWRVLPEWLRHRLRAPAGRVSSPLDAVRPERWTADLTQELLELVWVLEATVASSPTQNRLFHDVVAGPGFSAEELPQPTAAERAPPSSATDVGGDQGTSGCSLFEAAAEYGSSDPEPVDE